MKLVIVDTADQASVTAATLLAPYFRESESVQRIGLATGRTMIPIYAALARMLAESPKRSARAGGVETFNLDEYWPLAPDHPASFRQFMERHLFRHIMPWVRTTHFLDGGSLDPDQECGRYAALLQEAPRDVQLLGIGVNGHIGFNEPGTAFASRTRLVRLAQETLDRNQADFVGAMPEMALTMGIADIMEAHRIILVAVGHEKQEAVAQALWGPVTESCPASIIQRHPDAVVILDREAAPSA